MKQYLLALLPFFFLIACKTQSPDPVVKGTVKNLGDGEIYFIRSGDEKKIDTVKVIKDQFEYQTKVSEPTVFMVNFGPDQQPGFLILESGETTLQYEMGNMNSLNIKGGKEQDVYNQFLTMCRPVFTQMDSLGKVAMANEDNTDLLQNLQGEFYRLDGILKGYQMTFIEQHKGSYATAFIAINYFNEKMDKNQAEVEKVYNMLEEKIKGSYYGKKLAELSTQLKGTSEGQPAPDFTLNDVSGKPVSLSSFKGKITLIDFWASWCGPCRAENPHVVAAYEQYHDKGFDILGVSLDEDKAQWEKAIQKDGLVWTQVSDLKGWSSSAAALYGVQSIPSNFLLDKDGKIIAKDLRGDALEAKLKTLFP